MTLIRSIAGVWCLRPFDPAAHKLRQYSTLLSSPVHINRDVDLSNLQIQPRDAVD